MAAELGRGRGCRRFLVHSWNVQHAWLPRGRKAFLPGRRLEDGATQSIANHWHRRSCPGLANQLAARSGRVPDAARVCVRDDVRRLETGALAGAVLYTGTSQLFLLVRGNLGVLPNPIFCFLKSDLEGGMKL